MSLENQLAFAEQGLAADQAQLQKLQAERAVAEAAGQDTTLINKTIADLENDIEAGTQDVLDIQQNINTQAAADSAANQTAVPVASEPDTTTQAQQDNEEELDDNDDETLAENEDAPTDDEEEDPFEKSRQDAEERYNQDDQQEEITQESNPSVIEPFKIPTPVANPLHSYATYTYGITLYILTKQDYINLQLSDAGQLEGWKPSYALISSGGTHKVDRAAMFQDDFYFDNLRMTTVVGLNNRTRGTNAIDIGFTVIEPYGLTLLDRLIDAATSEEVQCDNYQDQPYLLEINFFGSRGLGDLETPIAGLTKRIPIKIIELKIKTGVKGSEYAIRAIPYNHSALTETINRTPVNFEVVAGTVEDFFKNELSNDMAAQIENKKVAKERIEAADRALSPNDPYIDLDTIASARKIKAESEQVLKAAYQADSYPGAINAWYKNNVDTKKIKVADAIEFVFDKEIAESRIVLPSKTDYNRTEMTSEKKLSSAVQGNDQAISGATPQSSLNKNKQTFNINAGTSIVDVVNMILRNSEYIRNQVVDPLVDSSVVFPEGKVINFYKIVPQIFLKEFDTSRNVYGKLVRYYVKKFSYYNTKHPNLPYAKPENAIKEYNYIYTGKNIDILDFNIDFDTAFYTTVVVDRKNAEKTNAATGADDPKENDINKRPYGGDRKSIARNKHVPISNDMSVAATGSNTTETTLAASVVKSIYSESRGDMLNLKLKILGDPHFIKQDDLYVNPGQSNYPDNRVMLNDGTISMDNAEIFCKVTFRTPVDMDQSTGLIRTDGSYVESKFSGLYKILTIDNEFSRGQFIQTLDCVRIFDSNSKTNTDDRKGKKQDSEAGLHEREPGWNETNAPQSDDSEGFPPAAEYDPQGNEEANQQAVEDAVDKENSAWPDRDDYGYEDDNQSEVDEQEGADIAEELGDEPEIDLSEFA